MNFLGYITLSGIVILVIYLFIRIRSTKSRILIAKQSLYKKASSFPNYSIETFINDNGLQNSRESVYLLLSALSDILKVSPEKLAYNHKISDLLTVPFCVFKDDKKVMQTDLFSDELLERIFSISDDDAWNQKLQEKLNGTEEVNDLILNMNMIEFLSFFAPFIKQKHKT